MKIIYTTDLHGHKKKYLRTLEHAKKLDVDAVVNGGDLLPVNPYRLQGSFISNFLDDHLYQYESASIPYLYVRGNTDLKCFDDDLQEVSSAYDLVENLSQKKVDLGGFEFIDSDLMADYPFSLKDRCRMDTDNSQFKKQLGQAFLSTKQGWRYLDDWCNYVKTLPTLEEELEKLPQPENMHRAVYVMHMPPAFLNLDVCHGNITVGSKAIYDFFQKKQPLLSFHGHIHESPELSRVWKSRIGDTWCIQPGQREEQLVYVICDLDKMEFHRFIEPVD